MQQGNIEVAFRLVELVALALPAIAILLQITTTIVIELGHEVSTPQDAPLFVVFRWAFLFFILGGILTLTWLITIISPHLIKASLLMIVIGLVLFGFGIWIFSAPAFNEFINLIAESVRKKFRR